MDGTTGHNGVKGVAPTLGKGKTEDTIDRESCSLRTNMASSSNDLKLNKLRQLMGSGQSKKTHRCPKLHNCGNTLEARGGLTGDRLFGHDGRYKEVPTGSKKT